MQSYTRRRRAASKERAAPTARMRTWRWRSLPYSPSRLTGAWRPLHILAAFHCESISPVHASSLENAQKCIDRYVGEELFSGRVRQIVELGSHDVNGSYRPLFSGLGVQYTGLDLQAGPGVDVVLQDTYHLP